MSETLIPFKVVSLVIHTLLPAVLPLLETFLESFLWNHVQLGCRVPHNVFSWLKSGPFQRHFQFGKQPKITRGHVGSWNHFLRGPACLVRFPGEAASAPSLAASARISWTPKSAVKMVCTDPMLTPTSSASSRTVIRQSCMSKVRTWLMTLSFRLVEGLPWRGSLVHWCAAIFEAVIPLFYSCDTHGIVRESLLNLSNSFHLGIAKLLAKLDAIPLLKSSRHFAIIDNLTSVHNTYTIIDRLPATDAFYWREKIHACA